MNIRKIFSLACFLTFTLPSLHAQEYVREMESSRPNFYQLQRSFQSEWEGRSYQKGLGYKQFKRWASFMEARSYPSGNLPDPMSAWKEMQRFHAQQQTSGSRSGQANWSQYMVHDTLSFTSFSTIPGHGRVSCVEVSPVDSNLLFVGTPSGGLWRSQNGGDSWSPLTDNLPVIGVADIKINPLAPQVIYLATGDNTFINTYSIGVLKSTDGGLNWNPTGLNYQVTQTANIRKLLIHPTQPDTLWAATKQGLMRTNDGGANWFSIRSGSFRDIEFKPNDTSVLFATTNGGFYRSTDGGATFSSSGLPENSAVIRMEIGTSVSNPDVVYVIAGDASNGGLYGLYRSTDAGISFAQTANTTNILGYWASGGTGGQAWYDLDIAVSPTDENTVLTAGIGIWKSSDGGDSFTMSSDWDSPTSSKYVHGDVHKLLFDRDRLFTTCDGGIFRSNDVGANWKDLSSNLSIHQIYSFTQSPFSDSVVLAGMQDVGSSIYDGEKWTTVTWGDGFDCFFDRLDDRVFYTSAHNGQFFRSITGIYGFSQYFPNVNGETSAFASVMRQDPVDSRTFYMGFQNVWKSTDATLSWTRISNFNNTFPLQRLEVSDSDPDVIYATTNFYVYRTTDGGNSWTTVTTGLPTNLAAISGLHIDPMDPMKVWVTFSGYVSGQKIYRSDDGGQNWINVSGNLPNLPANCALAERSTLNGLYVGMDVGVYYINDTLSSYLPFMAGLPNVIVNDLDLVPGSQLVRAATYGRGIWESDLFSEAVLVDRPEPSTHEFSFSLYPNPAGDRVNIKLNLESSQNLKIRVSDLAGRTLLQQETIGRAGNNPLQVNTNQLPAGTYLIELSSPAFKRTKKLIVQ